MLSQPSIWLGSVRHQECRGRYQGTLEIGCHMEVDFMFSDY